MRHLKANAVDIAGRIANIDIKNGNTGDFGTITIAVDDGYFQKGQNGQGGQWVDRTHFVDVKVGSRFLDKFKNGLSQGDEISLKGKLVQDKWKDNQTQQNRSALRVEAFELCGHVLKAEIECLKQGGFIGSNNTNSSQQGGFAPQHGGQKQGGFAPQQGGQQQGGFAPQQQGYQSNNGY